jgi:hypothetical protein
MVEMTESNMTSKYPLLGEWMNLMETLTNEKIQHSDHKPIYRQNEEGEKPCPLGQRVQECRLVELMIKAVIEENEPTGRLIQTEVLIPHLVTWHYVELEKMVTSEILEILRQR